MQTHLYLFNISVWTQEIILLSNIQVLFANSWNWYQSFHYIQAFFSLLKLPCLKSKWDTMMKSKQGQCWRHISVRASICLHDTMSQAVTWISSCDCMLRIHVFGCWIVMYSHDCGHLKIDNFSKKWHFHVSAWHWLPCDRIDALTVQQQARRVILYCCWSIQCHMNYDKMPPSRLGSTYIYLCREPLQI